jgi:hypothetical protein
MDCLFGNVTSTGLNLSIGWSFAKSYVLTNGVGVISNAALAANKYVMLLGTNSAFLALNSLPGVTGLQVSPIQLARTYTTGALSCKMNLTFPTGATIVHRSIFVSCGEGDYDTAIENQAAGIQILLDADQTKASTSSLSFSYTVAFTRL